MLITSLLAEASEFRSYVVRSVSHNAIFEGSPHSRARRSAIVAQNRSSQSLSKDRDRDIYSPQLRLNGSKDPTWPVLPERNEPRGSVTNYFQKLSNIEHIPPCVWAYDII
jgi:hypothetical protein